MQHIGIQWHSELLLCCTCSIWSEYARIPSRQAEVSIKISDSVEACACPKGISRIGMAPWWPSAKFAATVQAKVQEQTAQAQLGSSTSNGFMSGPCHV